MSIRRCRIPKRQTPAVLVISLSAAETYGPVGRRTPSPSCLCNNSIVKKTHLREIVRAGETAACEGTVGASATAFHGAVRSNADPRRRPAIRVDGIPDAPGDVAVFGHLETRVRAVPHPGAGQHLVAGGRGPRRGPVEIPRSAPAAMVRLRVCRVERRGAVGVHPGEAATRHERLLVVVLRALVPPMHAATGLAPRAAAARRTPRSSRRRAGPRGRRGVAQDPAVVEASRRTPRSSRRRAGPRGRRASRRTRRLVEAIALSVQRSNRATRRLIQQQPAERRRHECPAARPGQWSCPPICSAR